MQRQSASRIPNTEEEEVFYDAEEHLVDGMEEDSPKPQSGYVPPLGEVRVLHAGSEVVSLGFEPSSSSVKYKLHIDYASNAHKGSVIQEDCTTVVVEGLNPGTAYTFNITRESEDGIQSTPKTVSVFTEPVPPVEITVSNTCSDSVSLQWDTPIGEVESYIVTCCSDRETVREVETETNSVTISSLSPGECYSLHVYTKPKNGRISKPTETSAKTKTHLESLLEDVGLDQHTKKLSLSKILEIDEKTLSDESVQCNSNVPWYFLKKLMMVNVTARNLKCTSSTQSNCDAASGITKLDVKNLVNTLSSPDSLNPLDIITALFLCSDGFVQQEMALKMSMCAGLQTLNKKYNNLVKQLLHSTKEVLVNSYHRH